MSLFLIAEIGINHNGDLSIAKQLIDAAADAGFDAVKFQKRNSLSEFQNIKQRILTLAPDYPRWNFIRVSIRAANPPQSHRTHIDAHMWRN